MYFLFASIFQTHKEHKPIRGSTIQNKYTTIRILTRKIKTLEELIILVWGNRTRLSVQYWKTEYYFNRERYGVD